MMADGGFSVEGQENIQEILSKQLYLCQFLVAMSIVRTGGHFVCKLFDLFTPLEQGQLKPHQQQNSALPSLEEGI